MIELLLDSHALIWWLERSNRLPLPIHDRIETADRVCVSAATIWEITTKYGLGKLPSVAPIIENLDAILLREKFEPLPVLISHAHKAGLLPRIHRDPFDRMLIAQAMIENLLLVSNETLFDQYGVNRVW